MLIDEKQRLLAIDPEQSFIVQAPAGSGKTEILTQRYLRLLGRVQAPEQVIALTFTRKAASEMRERILNTLKQAASGISPNSEHQKRSFSAAHLALQQNAHFNWQLLEQPSRMRIVTIDSLCQTISQAIPLQDKQIPFANITDTPLTHYQEAVRACVRYAMENADYQESLAIILAHLDNREDRLLSLMSDLLANRDQWLSSLYLAKNQDKAIYEKALKDIEEHALQRLFQCIPSLLSARLMQLAKLMVSIENNPQSPRFLLQSYETFASLDGQGTRALAALLLTSQQTLRVGFDHHVGLKKDLCSASDYKFIKAESKLLLSELNRYPDFIDALIQVSNLPNPQYDPEQWTVLNAVFQLLPLLVGHLHLRFSDYNAVDFATVAQQALYALGDSDNPTDLALYLDNSIHHLLIDEFQDTSITQFDLLAQLVQGWQPQDGKTLFVVGDPMQSIYRFRQAEVGLFLKAQQVGIGGISLIPLTLSCNFRSNQNLIQWINEHFKTIFPSNYDIESGAVSFHPSTAVKEAIVENAVHALAYTDKDQEAKAIIEFLKYKLSSHPHETIAILVRSRNQLTGIIRLLREEAIPFEGVNINLLATLPHLRDVWSLTKALLMPANRLAWLELLRSPCCGLSLEDLHRLANINPKLSIYAVLEHQILSKEGQIRVNFVSSVMRYALSHRHQNSLSHWVSQTFKLLQGNVTLFESQQYDIEQFWNLLDKFEEDGQLADLTAFENELSKLHSQQAMSSPIKIMTIHKSKGLEFDTVILPGLGAVSQNQDRALLRWLKLPGKAAETLLISPIKAVHQESCALYDYIGDLEKQKDRYELQRLLYVAVTRAKKSLYLFNHSLKNTKNSFLHLLKNQEFSLQNQDETIQPEGFKLPETVHLPLEFYAAPFINSQKFLNKVSLNQVSNIPRITGIISHSALQWVCNNHPSEASEIPKNIIEQPLKYLALTPEEQQSIAAQVRLQIAGVFNSQQGRWIIQKHMEEKNEHAVLVEVMGKVVTRIIDRSFLYQGSRWVIDFKTGKNDAQAQAQHRNQVNEYATYLSQDKNVPVRCGLYYLTTDDWISW